MLDRLWAKCYDDAAPAIEVTYQHRTFSVLPVDVEDLDFVNLYGTDITAEKVVERFPNQNPNPVFRVERRRCAPVRERGQPPADRRVRNEGW